MNKKYRIWLSELPPTSGWPEAVPAAWFSYVPGIYQNDFLYHRSQEKKSANQYTAQEAVAVVSKALSRGYPAKCVPSITVTY